MHSNLPILVNIGLNPNPAIPEYYFNLFGCIYHICPGRHPGLWRELRPRELIYNIITEGFDIAKCLHRLPCPPEHLCIEIALESGLQYPSLSIPSNAFVMGRICDLHHLNSPLVSIYQFLSDLHVDCLLFSSCPHYIHLYEHHAPCFYLPTDIDLYGWNHGSFVADCSSRSIPIHLDGKLLSALHPGRSFIFNSLIAYHSHAFDLPEVRQYPRDKWLEILGCTRLVVQHGLNGNAHPPFLAALSRGALPIIDSLSAYTLSRKFNIDLSFLSYRCLSDLVEILRMPYEIIHRRSNISEISASVGEKLAHSVDQWQLFVRKSCETFDCRWAIDQFKAETIAPIDLIHNKILVIQGMQELIRRLAYFSKGVSLPLLLVDQAPIVQFDYETAGQVTGLYKALTRIWPLRVVNTQSIPAGFSNSITLSCALNWSAHILRRFPSAQAFQVDLAPVMSSIHISILLHNSIHANHPHGLFA
jgi:hypothetical protein